MKLALLGIASGCCLSAQAEDVFSLGSDLAMSKATDSSSCRGKRSNRTATGEQSSKGEEPEEGGSSESCAGPGGCSGTSSLHEKNASSAEERDMAGRRRAAVGVRNSPK